MRTEATHDLLEPRTPHILRSPPWPLAGPTSHAYSHSRVLQPDGHRPTKPSSELEASITHQTFHFDVINHMSQSKGRNAVGGLLTRSLDPQ